MKCLVIHNEYGRFSGEEAVLRDIRALLEGNGHVVTPFIRRSDEIPHMLFGEARAFFSGIYSVSSRRRMRRLLAECRPDVVQVQNLFPLISPSVLPECTRAGIPIVMMLPNYRLTCPSGLHMREGCVCEKCTGGREYWCAVNNCEGSFLKSVGYAARSYIARKCRLFRDNVTVYYALTEFQRQRMLDDGVRPDRIGVIPNMVMPVALHGDPPLGDYVAYAGRVSPEKGVDTLIAAARQLPDVQFKAAGSFDRMPAILDGAPPNFQFLGHLNGHKLHDFYGAALMLVLPSKCFEGLPIVAVEAMMLAKPVVCSRIGGLPEVVEGGVTGLLFEPGNSDELADSIRYLWERPELCRTMGEAGRRKALTEYSPQKYYERLMAIYRKAIELGPGGPDVHGV